MQEEKPMPAWEAKRDRWLAIVDEKARAHAAALLQEQSFWEQAPLDLEEAANPSVHCFPAAEMGQQACGH